MNCYIFDIDGTLTPSRDKINKDFLKWFLEFVKWHPVYLVTGSDRTKTEEQIGEELFKKVNIGANIEKRETGLEKEVLKLVDYG